MNYNKSGFIIINNKAISIKYDSYRSICYFKYRGMKYRASKKDISRTKISCIKKHIKTLKFNIETNIKIINIEQNKLNANEMQLVVFQKFIKNKKLREKKYKIKICLLDACNISRKK
jgi:hypothetical protein